MIRLKLIIALLFIVNTLYSQCEQEILTNALQSYNKELPKLEKRAFNELKKLDRTAIEFSDYHFIIIPMFRLKNDYVQYKVGETFANYIDFQKMHDDFTAFVFKDTIYKGSLHFSNCDNSFFSVTHLNEYNMRAYTREINLAKQIINFKPDMIFYPCCNSFLCYIKEGKLYIGTVEVQMQALDCILPFSEFFNKNPSFIKTLEDDKMIDVKHYIELK